MKFAEIIQFEGPRDALVWKYPEEDLNTTSQLIVDDTHEAILVINGNAADCFKGGKRTLELPNIPIAKKFIKLPFDNKNPFPCKVFFINMVHQMDVLWGTEGPIPLTDPFYDIFLHVMAHGSMTLSVADSRKFLLKVVGFKDEMSTTELIAKFRGIISSNVKDCIAKIMIKGMLSYFIVTAELMEISNAVKERLDKVFEEYGLEIHYFNIETIEVPDKDYQKVSEAKERRVGRMIEGYTWVEERQMAIAEKFAGNTGVMGNIGGMMGGFMMGGAMGGSIAEIARDALSPERIPKETPPGDVKDKPFITNPSKDFDVEEFFKQEKNSDAGESKKCPVCGATVSSGAKFCPDCGATIEEKKSDEMVCPRCGKTVARKKFCSECGASLAGVCPRCGSEVGTNAKFCPECGKEL